MSSRTTRKNFLAMAAAIEGIRGQDPAKLTESMPNLLRQTGVPGLSIAFIDDAKVSWSKGFGSPYA